MQKVVIHRPGSYERLVLEEHPDPHPTPGEVVVQVAAAGVNYADCLVRMGVYSSARELVGWPITPGFEVAGTVIAVGSAVTRVAVGDQVLGVTFFGGYATHLALPEAQVFPTPRAFTVEEQAAFPAAALTAWFALCELAHPRPGSLLLVHSAAGGVGSALVQIATHLGRRVVAVVGARHKVDEARRLGAEEVIDTSRDRLWPVAERHAPGGYDVILDANGAATLRESYRHLASPGKLVVYGFHSMLPRAGGRPSYTRLIRTWLQTPRFDPLALTKENRSVLAFNLSYLFERHDLLALAMHDLGAWAASGRLRPPRVTTYPMSRVGDAHRALESGTTVGKLVLLP